jgi:hypothetical protein
MSTRRRSQDATARIKRMRRIEQFAQLWTVENGNRLDSSTDSGKVNRSQLRSSFEHIHLLLKSLARHAPGRSKSVSGPSLRSRATHFVERSASQFLCFTAGCHRCHGRFRHARHGANISESWLVHASPVEPDNEDFLPIASFSLNG